jgi:beta-N-acetylhexosaminidase
LKKNPIDNLLVIILSCLIFFPTCEKKTDTVETETSEETIDPVRVRASEIAASLDDRLLAAQVLMSGVDGRGALPPHIRVLLDEFPAGGIMFFRYNLDTDNDSIRSLLAETGSFISQKAGIPPFLAVDHEGGEVNRFLRGVASLPAAFSYWEHSVAEGKAAALVKVEIDSLRAARELRALGFNMNFAPIAEHLTHNNKVFLGSRSYGTDPAFTADAAAAFVRSMELSGVLCVIKHFPGSAGPDPHYSPSLIHGDRDALNELVSPFSALFRGGARAVMVAHSAVPALDDRIASLSPVVMENWIRQDLGFEGLIISDDFSMAAAGGGSPQRAAVESLAAGADMVLVWQKDLRVTHEEIMRALEDGRLSRERLLEAAGCVVYEKLKLGLFDE